MITSKFLTKSFFWLGVLLLFSVSSCSIRANSKTVTYLIPENFEGGVVIVYDQRDGVSPDVTDNEIVFTIPADGILKTTVDAKSVGGKPRFFFVGKNGERAELELLYHWGPKYPEAMRSVKDISAEEQDKVFAMIFERGTFNSAGEVVMFSSFTVGKPKDSNISIGRTHGKISQVQRTFPR